MSGQLKVAATILVLVSLTVSAATAACLAGSLAPSPGSLLRASSEPEPALPTSGWTIEQLGASALAPAPDQEPNVATGTSTLLGPVHLESPANPLGTTEILVSLDFSNASRLNLLLSELSNPATPQYHHYLTHAQFNAEFGGNPSVYSSLVQYFESFGVDQLQTHPDRLAISFQATPSQIESIFHTELGDYLSSSGQRYFAPLSPPMFPLLAIPYIAEIQGFSNYSEYLNHVDSSMVTQETLSPIASALPAAVASPSRGGLSVSPGSGSNPFTPTTVGGLTYDEPVHEGTAGANCDSTICGQLMFGPDLQVTYNETGLFTKYGYPANATVVALLWSDTVNVGSSGTDGNSFCASATSGDYSWDFFMPDVTAFWNYTMPSGEPMPRAISMPQSGSSAYYYPSSAPGDQGYSSTCDSGGAEGENTLDVAMEGSLAPGANVFQVFGQGSSTTSITTGFSDILSPSSSDFSTTGGFDTTRNIADLENASVIANSWTSSGSLGTAWNNDLKTAQALGITVLASSGDSGNNAVDPPAEAAYNTYGAVAVGGTTLVVSPSTLIRTADHLFSSASPYDGTGGGEIVWYEPSGTVDGFSSTYGSVGGVASSSSYYAPTWQNNSSDAHGVITGITSSGYGRGEPDIAAIANDTEIDLDEGYYSFNITCVVTSSCTQVSKLGDGTEVGYTYFIGTSISDQVAGGIVATIDYALHKVGEGKLGFLDPAVYPAGQLQYAGDLKLHSFKDITLYHNAEPSGTYGAFAGWDAVTGWGSIDAGNYTQNTLTYPIVFTESGLPTGTKWSVTVGPEVGDAGCVVSGSTCTNNVTTTSSTSTVTFNEPYGPFSYTINPPIGYTATPASGTVTQDGTSQAAATSMTTLPEGAGAIAELYTVYNARADLQAAFPNAYTSTSSYDNLVSWAGRAVSESMDSNYSLLAAYGHWYLLMEIYNGRSDLQTAFPGAYTSSTEYANLVGWAGSVVQGQSTDGAYSSLAPYGYWYVLMDVYNGRSDLQSAYPNAYSNPTNFEGLVGWAGNVVTGLSSDGANDSLQPFGYWYALLGTYNNRPDLQTAFPNAYTQFTKFTGLVNWAGTVVTKQVSDGAYTALSPFGYYYDLMMVYDGRTDLQSAFPYAFTFWTNYQGLAFWAGTVTSGEVVDGANATLQPYGYWYVLMGLVYEKRPDLQTAYPLAFTNYGNYHSLLVWAKDVVEGVFPDGAYSVLLPYASEYETLG